HKHERIRGRMQLAAESIIAVGRELIEQKKSLGHGNFLPWIEAEFGMSADTASRFINVANNIGEKFRSVRNLPPTALYALAAPSTPPEVRAVHETAWMEIVVSPGDDLQSVHRVRIEESKRAD